MENRESFRALITDPPYGCIFTREEIARMELAYMVAKYGHRGQVRKETDASGKPQRYFEHPRRVATFLLRELKIPDAEMVMAGFFHDCPEDTSEVDEMTVEIVGGQNVARMVKLLTKKPATGYVERLMEFGDWRTLVLKGCDRLDNLQSLISTEAAFRKKQLKETREKYYPLFDRMLRITPPAYADQAATLMLKIRTIVDQLSG